MVCTDPNTNDPITEEPSNTIGMYWRSHGLSDQYQGSNIFRQDMVAHPDVNWRYVAWQTGTHAGGISEIEFDGDKTWPLQEQGRKDAQALLSAGENTHVELFRNWFDSKELREEYPTYSDMLQALQ